MSQKSKVNLLVSVVLLMLLSSVVTWVYATSPSLWLDPRGSQQVTASYIVFKLSSVYYARNGATGRLDYSSSSGVLVINYAISHLSVGRTNFETIVVKGEFSLTSYISITESHVYLDLTGAYITGNGGYIIKIDKGGIHDVTIDGGVLFGYPLAVGLNKAQGYTGIYCYGNATNYANNIVIKNIKIIDSLWCGVLMAYTDNFLIENIQTENSGFHYTGSDVPHGMYLAYIKNGRIIGHKSYADCGSAVKINCANNVIYREADIQNVTWKLTNQYGIFINGEASSITDRVIISENIIIFNNNTEAKGIATDTSYNTRISIVSNTIKFANNGIILNDAMNSTIIGNICEDIQYAGIRELSDSDYNVICLNNVFDCALLGGDKLTIAGANDEVANNVGVV